MIFLVQRIQSNICASQLCDEIEANSNITTSCDSVRIDDGDQLSIYFSTEPSASELLELDTVILPNHVCVEKPPSASDLEIKLNQTTTLIDASSLNYEGNVLVQQDMTDPNNMRQVTIDILGTAIEKDDTPIITEAYTLNFEGNVSIVDENNNKATAKIGGDRGLLGGIYQLVFVEESSDVANEWLSHYGDTSLNSNQTFGIIPWKSKIIGLSYSNRDDNSDTDIRIYSTPQGGGTSPKTLEFTWSLRDARVARKTNFSTDIILDAGDHVGIYVSDQGINPDYVVFIMYLQIIEETFEESVEQFSGNMAVGSGGGSS